MKYLETLFTAEYRIGKGRRSVVFRIPKEYEATGNALLCRFALCVSTRKIIGYMISNENAKTLPIMYESDLILEQKCNPELKRPQV